MESKKCKNNELRKKLLYLLGFVDQCIEKSIYDVLADSEEDPHYSAVSVCNLLNCYISIIHEINIPTEFVSIKEYMHYNCFTAEEIAAFMDKKNRELDCYIGEQF